MNRRAGHAAVHPPEHGIGAALHREVQVRANPVGALGHQRDQLRRDLGRLDARQPHAEIAGEVGELPDEQGESGEPNDE